MEQQQVTELANQYGASLVLYARQWSRDPDDALQEALLDLLQQVPPPRDPVAWLFTTVKRKAMNHARSESRRQKHATSIASQRDAWFETPPEKSLQAEEIRRQLQRLPDIEREIVVARIWGELNWQQIGGLVQRPRSTVHRRYQAALEKLAACTLQNETTTSPNTKRVVR